MKIKKVLSAIMCAIMFTAMNVQEFRAETKAVVIEPEYGNYLLINMYDGEPIPVYEKIVESALYLGMSADKTRQIYRHTAGGKIIGYIGYKDMYIQQNTVDYGETYYKVIFGKSTPQDVTIEGEIKQVLKSKSGFIDRRIITTEGAIFQPWVSDQKYFTDYRGGGNIQPIRPTDYVTHPVTKAKFVKYVITRDTPYYYWEEGEKDPIMDMLPKGTVVGLRNSITGNILTNCISMYTFFKNGKWVDAGDGYWLVVDFSRGPNVSIRTIQ